MNQICLFEKLREQKNKKSLTKGIRVLLTVASNEFILDSYRLNQFGALFDESNTLFLLVQMEMGQNHGGEGQGTVETLDLEDLKSISAARTSYSRNQTTRKPSSQSTKNVYHQPNS